MTKSLLALSLLVFAASTFATVKIEEELYIVGQNPEVVKDLVLAGSVEIDHVSKDGFELFGSKGLSLYLNKKGILHFNMKNLNKKAFAGYPTHDQIIAKLKAAEAKNPSVIKVFSIGKSIQGRDLVVVKISDNVNTDEVEPEFKYISSMHGDEITGRELTTFLVEEIAEKYGSDSELTELVNNTEIYIMPSMNPDGSALKQRGNARGVDLNRNFPDFLREQNSSVGRALENQAVMKFQGERKFSLSANFHGGTIVANYPWDATYDRHPLDAFIKELSIGYAELNPEMRTSSEFPGGITNGADWYVVKGGMQDWSSFWYNDLQITIELSHDKYPNYNAIPGFYRSNRDSMVYFMKQVHSGAGFKIKRPNVSGTVAIKQTAPVVKDMGSYAFSGSEFYKVMPEGEYTYTITEKRKNRRSEINVVIKSDSIASNGNFVEVN